MLKENYRIVNMLKFQNNLERIESFALWEKKLFNGLMGIRLWVMGAGVLV